VKYPAYPAYQPTSGDGLRCPLGWRLQRLRFAVATNPVKSELANWPDDMLVSFVPMEAVGETGGLSLSQDREIAEVYNGYSYFAEGDVVVAKITPCFENGKGAPDSRRISADLDRLTG
jgi:type I restriction enzyme S subunit